MGLVLHGDIAITRRHDGRVFASFKHHDGYAHGNWISEAQVARLRDARRNGSKESVIVAAGGMIRSLKSKLWYEVV